MHLCRLSVPKLVLPIVDVLLSKFLGILVDLLKFNQDLVMRVLGL